MVCILYKTFSSPLIHILAHNGITSNFIMGFLQNIIYNNRHTHPRTQYKDLMNIFYMFTAMV